MVSSPGMLRPRLASMAEYKRAVRGEEVNGEFVVVSVHRITEAFGKPSELVNIAEGEVPFLWEKGKVKYRGRVRVKNGRVVEFV